MLLVGHGTSDPVGTQQFFELGRLLAARCAPIPVQPCLLELQSPTIAEGWRKLMDCGCQRVLAAPLLLFSAGHAKRDIPEALRACCPKDTITFCVSRPLSRAPEIVELLLRRIGNAAATISSAQRGSRQAVVLVGRGSHDPCAQADLKLLCVLLQHRLEVKTVQPAYYAMAKPDLSQALADLASHDSLDCVIVQPHLLFDGLIYRNLIAQVEAARKLYPKLRLVVGEYLGPDPLIASALERRLQQALAKDAGWVQSGSS